MQIKLMTYNIHKGIGGIDRKYRLDRIIETVSNYNPDVLCLQEVDDGVPRSRGDRQIDIVGDALGYAHRAYQPNVYLQRGAYGNAVLSHHAFFEVHDVDLTIWPKKRRRAQVVKMHIDLISHDAEETPATRTVVIANLHLGLAAFERRRQLRTLFDGPPLARMHHATPLIVAGDFNDVWQNLGNGQLRLGNLHSALGNARTFPAAFPMRCLDGIYYRGQLRAVRGFAGHIEIARHASDHLPAIAEFTDSA